MKWGRRDLNSHALPHMILSHACLPIPALPLEKKIINQRTRLVNKSYLRISGICLIYSILLEYNVVVFMRIKNICQ